jgi:DNA recombination protein RmuC
MVPDILYGILMIAIAAAVALHLVARARAIRLRSELSGARQQVNTLSEELRQVRSDAENWRQQFHDERIARTREEATAARVPQLEQDLRGAQEKAVTIANELFASDEQAGRIPGLESDIEGMRLQIAELSHSNAELGTRLSEQVKAHEEKLAALTAIRGEIEKDLKNIASDTLRQNQESFLTLADQVLSKHKEGAAADLDARKEAIEQLVGPMRETLAAYQTGLAEIEKARVQTQGALSVELRNVVETQIAVRTETSKLVNALRAAPKTRGRWGENTLRNVLELAGLSPYCDFSIEATFHRDGEILRPDVIIRLSGGRSLVVDAKTSVSAYIDAVEAVEDEVRDRHLRLHAAQIRTHVKQLSSKAYWDGLAETPDCVVMFVPGENFYAAATERDPNLFEDALAHRVLIATPATLIAIAKAIAFGWRQEKVAENARRVHELGRELYSRLSKMGEHVIGLGKSLESTVKRYNDFVGSLETRVMPQARRFTELEVEGTAAPIEVTATVELLPKQVQPDRDLVLAPVDRGTPPVAALA